MQRFEAFKEDGPTAHVARSTPLSCDRLGGKTHEVPGRSALKGKVEALSRHPGERDRVYFVVDTAGGGQASRIYEADPAGPRYRQF